MSPAAPEFFGQLRERIVNTQRRLAVRWMAPLAVVLVAGSGCAAAGREAPAAARAAGPAGQASAASERSRLRLKEIGPDLPAPAHGEVEELSERAARRVDRATELIAEQRFTEAALELERGLRYQPDHPVIQRTLALLHWEAGNIERARKHAELAIAARADEALAHYVRGRVLARDGDRSGAIAAFRTALKCGNVGELPGLRTLLHYQLAEALAAEGYWTAALEEYEAFEEEAKTSPNGAAQLARQLREAGESAGLQRAELLEKLGRFADAAALFGQLAQQRPADAGKMQMRQARALLEAGQTEAALAVARNLPAKTPGVLELLEEIHRTTGHPERIVEDIRRIRASGEADPGFVLRAAGLLRETGRIEEAESLLRDQLKHDAGAVTVREALVDVLLEGRKFAEALSQAGELIVAAPEEAAGVEARIAALARDPDAVGIILGDTATQNADPMTLYLRGVVAEAAGRQTRAAELFEASLSQDARLVGPRVALARRYLDALRYDDALRVARGGTGEDGAAADPRLEFVIGQILERLGNTPEAETHYRNALQRDPENADAMLALAELYIDSDRPLNAQRELRALLERSPENNRARERLALLYLDDNQTEQAVKEFRILKDQAKSVNIRARATAFLSQYPTFDGESYRKALQEALGDAPPDVTTRLAMAESFNALTDAARRLEAYRKAVETDPQSEAAILGLVTSLKENLEYEEAIEQLAHLLPRRPARDAWVRELIELYWIVQDYDKAAELARSMLECEGLSDEQREGYRLRLVDTLRFAGKADEAARLMEDWSHEGDGRTWRRRLARLYELSGDAARAIPIYEALMVDKKLDGDVTNAFVDALISAKQYDRAVQLALDPLLNDPENDNAVQRLVLVLASAERYDEASELVRNTILRTRYREAFQWLLAGVLQQAKRYDEAARWAESLLDEVLSQMERVRLGRIEPPDPNMTDRERLVQPNDPVSARSLQQRLAELRFLLAGILARAGEHRRVQSLVEEQWLKEPSDPGVRFELLRALAMSYQMQGEDEQATERLAQALVINPGDVGLNNDVAYGWIDHGVHLDEAEKMIRFALSRAPRQGAYLDTFGWLLYKKGAFADAKKWLERAAKARTEDDPVVNDHLGDASWRLGLKEEAIKYWSAAQAAAEKMGEEELISADLKRVKQQVPQKLEAARSGGAPEVAPLGKPQENEADGTEGS